VVPDRAHNRTCRRLARTNVVYYYVIAHLSYVAIMPSEPLWGLDAKKADEVLAVFVEELELLSKHAEI
jgi:hypothetical protein